MDRPLNDFWVESMLSSKWRNEDFKQVEEWILSGINASNLTSGRMIKNKLIWKILVNGNNKINKNF